MTVNGMLPKTKTYDGCYDAFKWDIPEHFNIASAVCDRHAKICPHKVAVIYESAIGAVQELTFSQLQRNANQLANVLSDLNAKPGECIGIHLPQSLECAISHVGIYKTGAIALPLFSLFGPDALSHRLTDSAARILITCSENLPHLKEVQDQLSALEHVIVIDGAGEDLIDWHEALASASDQFETRNTKSEDPALLIYTSGTTGNPKGALHAHRVLLGHMPGVEFPHEFFPHADDLFWTPADWAWAGGLLDVMLPSLFHGITVLAKRFAKFEPEAVMELMAKHQVRNTFMPATALRMLQQVKDPKIFGVNLRSIASGGEALGEAIIEWGRDTFGVTINEFYGQTEVNLVVANNAKIMNIKPGSMGLPVPGHRVAVIDVDGNELPAGEEGLMAVQRPDPVMFLGYWNNVEGTRSKFIGDWCVLGDLGHRDEDGYFWFKARDDDVIISSSYRIGPTEVEECLLLHPAIILAGVIGSPDLVRGEIVKSYVTLAEGYKDTVGLREEIQAFVRKRLSAHEYPRQVRIISEMPLTVSGKIRRVALRELDAKERDI
jgi:acetyl-CoA synthetase|tara:strand:+ start:1101 stop:2747 length:1647 start_codon:yes stop_codon:yes gene_type:complete